MERGWLVIRDFIDVLSQEGSKFALYRGQPNAEWSIVPSIYRRRAFGIRDQHHLNDWKSRASRFASPLPRDNVEWLILAQHYGLSTALLDWSTSPLVALFFACDEKSQSRKPGCVWTIRRKNFIELHETLMIDPFTDNLEKPILISAIGQNVRSTAQDSLMSLHSKDNYQDMPARKIFDIKAADKKHVIATLEKLGLTAERLHFDITMLVSRFKEEQESRTLVLTKAVGGGGE